MTVPNAEIYDRGYRTYDGPRTGIAGAMKTLIWESIRAILGMGRSARHKVIPAVVVLLAYVPVIVFVGLAVLLPDEIGDGFLPTYADYYGFITTSIFLFVAFVGPELLCTDRRTGMLGVYLASPLDRVTYLMSKFLANMSLLALVTVGPPLLLLLALSIEGSGPEGWGAFFSTMGKIFIAGLMMSTFYTAVSMAISSTTDRKGYAIATTIGVLVASGILSTNLTRNDFSFNYRLVDILSLPPELASRIHGEIGTWVRPDTQTLWLGAVGIAVACLAFVWLRYRQLLVRR